MKYKQKVYILSGTVVFLGLVYAITFLFDSQNKNARDSYYTWLSTKDAQAARSIKVSTMNDGLKEARLEKRDAGWVVINEGKEYPAKIEFVDDLLKELSTSKPYPIRSRTEAAHEKLGVKEDAEKRIQIYGAEGIVLLDLLVGGTDTTGKKYMRKNGLPEVRSGEDGLRSWGTYLPGYYDLSIFPQNGEKKYTVQDVQRILIQPLPVDPASPADETFEPWVLVRNGKEWRVEGKDDVKLDAVQAENYVRAVLDARADDFVFAETPFAEEAKDAALSGGVSVQTGYGKEYRITVSPEKTDGKNMAVVTGRDYVYSLSGWTVNQLLKNYEDMVQK
ncbi:MAG: hypothetical protein LBC53_07060 [Spirochaetaceae bacterium]|jgi:hypothetical protein|nr:hypothetical protein [Spirochaetaceae bacterium]